jgi:hypothetical protein
LRDLANPRLQRPAVANGKRSQRSGRPSSQPGGR